MSRIFVVASFLIGVGILILTGGIYTIVMKFMGMDPDEYERHTVIHQKKKAQPSSFLVFTPPHPENCGSPLRIQSQPQPLYMG